MAFSSQIPTNDLHRVKRFVVRVERRTPIANGRISARCAVVYPDGRYHTEVVVQSPYRPGPGEVREGDLTPQERKHLENLLSDPGLRSLTPAQIGSTPLVIEDPDLVTLAVLRGDTVQFLSFPSRSSRKRFKNSVQPLLTWLDSMIGRKGAKMKAPLTRCSPEAAR
jgi:hypothetical protein